MGHLGEQPDLLLQQLNQGLVFLLQLHLDSAQVSLVFCLNQGEVLSGWAYAHALLNDSDPGAPVIPGCRVDLIHLRGCGADQKHPFLLVGDVSHN